MSDAELICLVDDDPSVRKALVRLLRSAGYEAMAFAAGAEFLEFASVRTVHLAILDVWMPQMSGLELQTALKQLSPQTPVIVISAREENAICSSALEGGAYRFLSKPMREDDLLAAVESALGRG